MATTNYPVRYGPLAGKIIAGAEEVTLLYAFAADGTTEMYNIGVAVEDIDLVISIRGDILVTQEVVGATTGLFRLHWDGTTLTSQQITLTADSAIPAQWEHVTMAPAGIVEIPPVD